MSEIVCLVPGIGSSAESVPVVALKKLTSVPQSPHAIFLTRTQSWAGRGVLGRFFVLDRINTGKGDLGHLRGRFSGEDTRDIFVKIDDFHFDPP